VLLSSKFSSQRGWAGSNAVGNVHVERQACGMQALQCWGDAAGGHILHNGCTAHAHEDACDAKHALPQIHPTD
jgi:hypothetical protein